MRMQTNMVQQHRLARMKRPLDAIDSNSDISKHKKSRISIEIQTIPNHKKLQTFSHPKAFAVERPERLARPTVVKPPPPQPRALPPAAIAAQTAPAKTATQTQKPLSNSQRKVSNGLKHELDNLQPITAASAPPREQGRKLRSQEATRFKSELSAYFPDYDEVIGNDEKEHHILNVDTPILIYDSAGSPHTHVRTLPSRQAAAVAATTSHPPQLQTKIDAEAAQKHAHRPNLDRYPIRSYGDGLFTDLFDSQQIDFTFLGTSHRSNVTADPLPDSHFEPAHRKAERLEKSIRNTEKGRAQHEKDQIIRLLGELQGPDWLRTMGVSGVTESKKKTFEPARDHFVRGCQAILDKFRWWSQEEKRRKLDRERALAEEAEDVGREVSQEPDEEQDEDDEAAGDDAEEEEGAEESVQGQDVEMADAGSAEESPGSVSESDPPDSSDVDASIAKQLREEVLASAKFTSSASLKRSRGEPLLTPELDVKREFRSFFEKKHEREVALSNVRRSRRIAKAWGHDVPEAEEGNFNLTEEYRDEETMKARERRKRRDRRGV
ncbi:something about silencing, SAS, complex subunit 4-domain-containing protein [Xylariales sp. PMI_506]|nr:something about silencing, SAS, complex subunit 4-domain-containing protein [Xylariales sp. PMI_506]